MHHHVVTLNLIWQVFCCALSTHIWWIGKHLINIDIEKNPLKILPYIIRIVKFCYNSLNLVLLEKGVRPITCLYLWDQNRCKIKTGLVKYMANDFSRFDQNVDLHISRTSNILIDLWHINLRLSIILHKIT